MERVAKLAACETAREKAEADKLQLKSARDMKKERRALKINDRTKVSEKERL